MHIVQQVNPRLNIQAILQESAEDASRAGYVPSKQMSKLLHSSLTPTRVKKKKSNKKKECKKKSEHLRKAKKKIGKGKR